VSSICAYIHLSCRQYKCTLHISPYHRVFPPRNLSIKMDHTATYVGDCANIRWSGFLHGYRVEAVFVAKAQQTAFFKGELFAPFENRITRQSLSDSACWRVVRESQVTVLSHSTAPISRSPRMAQLLSCSQFKDLGQMRRDKIKRVRNRIMQKRLRYYINNCPLSNPKGRAIKALTSTNRGENQLAFRSVLWPSNVLVFSICFLFPPILF